MTTIDRSAADTPLRDLLAALGGTARLLASDGDHERAAAVTVRDVTHDSREVADHVLFACRPGRRTDGHDHAPAAVAAGAPALLVERRLDLPVPQLAVDSVAEALGPVAAEVHGHPSAELLLLGVTGTNGKTTTAYLLEAVLQAAGHTTGLVGTVETHVAGQRLSGIRTTPEATDLQRLFRRMRGARVTGAAMEVSSHGLALGRVRGTRFSAALFTNLTQDHLDFHGDMAAYFAAKASLFDAEYTPVGVVNVDDQHGRHLAETAPIRILAVSTTGRPADVSVTDVDADAAGAAFTATIAGRPLRARVGLPGLFNVANAALALGAAAAVGIDAETAAAGVADCRGVPGRMERVEAGQPYTVLVDYAHTPDSLANVLGSVRTVASGRVIVVIGCGGDRDAGKRPLMGRVAAELADHAIFTSDNPRSEDPQAILDAVVAGARPLPGASWTAVLDRREAIAQALAAATDGDVVVVAGKGHESGQEIGGVTVPFDDRVVVRELLGAAA